MAVFKIIKIGLMHTPLVQVEQAYRAICANPVASFSKGQMAEWLAQRVMEGTVSEPELQAALQHGHTPVMDRSIAATVAAAAPPVAPAVPLVGQADILAVKAQHQRLITDLAGLQCIVAGLQSTVAHHNAHNANTSEMQNEALRRIEAAAAVATRAEALALEQAGLIADADAKVTTLGASLSKVEAIKQEVIDQRTIDAQVTRAIESAFKPFREAVISAGAEATVGGMVAVSVADRKTAKHVFGVLIKDHKSQDVMVDLFDAPNAPPVDPSFIWQKDILQVLLLAQDTGMNVFFAGEKGAGKTATAQQWSAKTGRPFTRINFHKHATVEDFVGATGLDANGTTFKPGDFLQAFTTPGSVILLDELSLAMPDVSSIFNSFMEPQCAVNFGGKVWRRAPHVLLLCADNTAGSGDDSGRFAGTKTMNQATVDRFSLIVPFTFLPRAVEIEALQNHTGCSGALAGHVLDAIAACRAKVKSGDIIDAPSIRSAIAFIRACYRLPVDSAWEMSITARQPVESAPAVQAIYKACINPEFIKTNL